MSYSAKMWPVSGKFSGRLENGLDSLRHVLWKIVHAASDEPSRQLIDHHLAVPYDLGRDSVVEQACGDRTAREKNHMIYRAVRYDPRAALDDIRPVLDAMPGHCDEPLAGQACRDSLAVERPLRLAVAWMELQAGGETGAIPAEWASPSRKADTEDGR